MPSRQPLLFVSHGAPTTALEKDSAFARSLARFGAANKPRAIVVMSAHWETRGGVSIASAPRPPLLYDFGGFAPELYQIKYPCPGSPELALQVQALLQKAGTQATLDPRRGLDHGAWTPLVLGWPGADLPVVQISLPEDEPAAIAALGAALSPLRDEGVLLLGSGTAVHNLRKVRFGVPDGPPEQWAQDFDTWLAGRVQALDLDSLERYRTLAPHAATAQPTPDHFNPLFFVLGAARDGDAARTVYEGFQYGTLSMRTFAIERASSSVIHGNP